MERPPILNFPSQPLLSQENLLMVVNPKTHRGHGGGYFKNHMLPRLERLLGFKPQVIFTSSPNHTSGCIPEHFSKGITYFGVVGGDGTLNDACQNFPENGILIPFPLGNANDFARRMGIHSMRHLINPLKKLKRGIETIRKIDLGEIFTPNRLRVRKFLNQFGYGVTAQSVKIANNLPLKFYKLAGFQAMMISVPFQTEVSLGGEVLNGFTLGFEFLLTSKVGRNIQLAPLKSEGDGTLALWWVNPMNSLKKIELISKLQNGKALVSLPGVHYLDFNQGQGDRTLWVMGTFQVNLEENRFFHVDGNFLPDRDFASFTKLFSVVHKEKLSVCQGESL